MLLLVMEKLNIPRVADYGNGTKINNCLTSWLFLSNLDYMCGVDEDHLYQLKQVNSQRKMDKIACNYCGEKRK